MFRYRWAPGQEQAVGRIERVARHQRGRADDFKSRVYAVGPQVGYLHKVGKATWYANLKSYHEFAARNRPEGWNLWLTLAIPL